MVKKQVKDLMYQTDLKYEEVKAGIMNCIPNFSFKGGINAVFENDDDYNTMIKAYGITFIKPERKLNTTTDNINFEYDNLNAVEVNINRLHKPTIYDKDVPTLLESFKDLKPFKIKLSLSQLRDNKMLRLLFANYNKVIIPYKLLDELKFNICNMFEEYVETPNINNKLIAFNDKHVFYIFMI